MRHIGPMQMAISSLAECLLIQAYANVRITQVDQSLWGLDDLHATHIGLQNFWNRYCAMLCLEILQYCNYEPWNCTGCGIKGMNECSRRFA